MDGKSKSLFKMMWRFKIEMPNRMDGKPKVLFNMLWRFLRLEMPNRMDGKSELYLYNVAA